MRAKAEMIAELKRLLHDVFVTQADGASYVKLARDRGYVDGYMRALLESGQCSNKELLEIVARERANVSGPATRELGHEAAEIAAA